jgi:hypothetical protein
VKLARLMLVALVCSLTACAGSSVTGPEPVSASCGYLGSGGCAAQ